MDASERIAHIQQLQREADEGRERIRRRQEERESNPELEHDFIMAEAAETQRRAPVQREAPAGALVYRERHDALVTVPEANADWSQWEAWLDGHLEVLRSEVADSVARAIGLVIASTRKEIEAKFKAEIADLRRAVAERDERAKALADVKREFASERAEREALQLSAALAARDARITALEDRLQMLLRFLSLSGIDPPRGL
jgi:hypothetical protein